MKAVFIRDFGDSSNLVISEVERPVCGASEVSVRVRAAGLNRADILQRKGLYPPPQGYDERVPGLEFAGIIDSIGADVSSFRIGDRVMGIVPGGAQAEFVTTRPSLLIRIPDEMSFEDAAAVPEVFTTAYDALISRAELKRGEVLLIHAIASGVGLAALQIGINLGAKVVGTSRVKEKLDRCSSMGLYTGILVDEGNRFAETLKDSIGNGADVILDLVGAKYLSENISAARMKGRIILVGLTGGSKSEVDLSQILSKRLSLFGSVLRSRSLEEREGLAELFRREMLPLFEKKLLQPTVDSVFPIDDIQVAHDRLESNQTFGKVVITF